MNEELKKKLAELGLTDDQVGKLEAEGVVDETTMVLLNADQVKTVTGCGLVAAINIVKAFAPAKTEVATAAPAGSTAPEGEEIPEGATPTTAQVNSFAGQLGIDPSTLSMLLFANMGAGAGIDMDLSGLVPIPQIVGGYNPKIRNMPFLIMGQVEKRLGSPVVVINSDGSVNPDLTVKHIMSLEEGFDAPEDNIYYDEAGAPYEIIKVGVDAQGIYDADPVNSANALQKNGMGIGRINWHGVSLEVRQVVNLAARQTGELDAHDEAKLSWLRSNIKPATGRLQLRGEFPKALAAYNEAARTGSLPTLRVQLSRAPRRAEVMPRRRLGTPRDFNSAEVEPAVGAGFRGERGG